jgi:hypothetical protein
LKHVERKSRKKKAKGVCEMRKGVLRM